MNCSTGHNIVCTFAAPPNNVQGDERHTGWLSLVFKRGRKLLHRHTRAKSTVCHVPCGKFVLMQHTMRVREHLS